MIMNVFPVKVGSDYHLKPVTPQLLSQVHADLMGLFRGDLTWSKRLVTVERDNTALLAKLPLD